MVWDMDGVGKELRRSKIWWGKIYPGIAGVLRGAQHGKVAELILSWTEVHYMANLQINHTIRKPCAKRVLPLLVARARSIRFECHLDRPPANDMHHDDDTITSRRAPRRANGPSHVVGKGKAIELESRAVTAQSCFCRLYRLTFSICSLLYQLHEAAASFSII